MDALRVSVIHANDGCRVTVAGELDLATVPLLHNELEAVNGVVVVDCAELTFADSSGIAELLVLANRVESVTLVGSTSALGQLVETLGLTEILLLGEE